MIRHNDSMRRTRMRRSRRSNHSRRAPHCLANTVVGHRTTASGSSRIFSNRRQRPRPQEELAMTRSRYTASSQARSIARCPGCRPAQRRMRRTSQRRTHKGKRSGNTIPMEITLCMVWRSPIHSSSISSQRPRSTSSRCRNTGNGRILSPRHYPPTSVFHKHLNITLQVKQGRLAHQHPSYRLSNCKRNINRPATRNLDNRSRNPIPAP